jgi:predicted TIM-barrel fold metal-dependent hydrolase
VQLTNCHIHTFTAAHAPDRFAGLLGELLRIRPLRQALLGVVRLFNRPQRNRFSRYARILEVSHNRSQEDIFKIARGFYPQGTRFVVLPMDMAYMNAGKVKKPLYEQHDDLRKLRQCYGDLVIPFAAVDPRRPGVVSTTIRLLEEGTFRGIKLYPPLGYAPDDPRLEPLYAYADDHGIPVLTHCSRGGVQYRGWPAEAAERLADPDNYVRVLEAHPMLKLCLAHFGGGSEWRSYLEDPWLAGTPARERSWLAKIADMIRGGKYPNLYTDISYTVFADDDYIHLLKVLLSDQDLRRRVLFGSDFYVVENAENEERRVALRVRSVLGEELFRAIAEENPAEFLG